MDETGKALPGKKGGLCGLQDLRAMRREEGGGKGGQLPAIPSMVSALCRPMVSVGTGRRSLLYAGEKRWGQVIGD